MAKVDVNIEEVDDIEDDSDPDRMREGVRATCTECNHVTESYGTGPRSRVRCIMLMKEECPTDGNNYYVDTDA